MDLYLVQQGQRLRYQLSKLQAYKSSFQAWKCVSFGYALLAMVLLLAKWHEVNTDLRLLTGIDQLIWASTLGPTNGSQANISSGAVEALANSTFRLRSWPPLPLETLLLSAAGQLDPEPAGSGSNSSSALVDALAAAAEGRKDESEGESAAMTNSSAARLMSRQMQMMAGREQSGGGELLRQEVEAFLAEFRSAKSTLSLSSLLVAVYILSWILMTLAVNDARISNDVSLRNILVLSVFGAIDMAASSGFVMVRLIMFNVKNNHFVAQILGSSGLRESSVRLSADQLAAFTAFRLIAMRSCSASVDVYVSVLVALLTSLRLYAIIRAIAYYRFLRHFNDCNRNLSHQQQLAAAFHASSAPEESKQRYSMASESGAFVQESVNQPKAIWHHQQQLAGQQANMSSNPQASSVFAQHVAQLSSARATPVQHFSLEPQLILTSPTGQTSAYVASSQQPQTLRSVNMRPLLTVDYNQQQQPHGTSKNPLSPARMLIEPQPGKLMPAADDETRNALRPTNQHQRSPQLLLTTANTLAGQNQTETRTHEHHEHAQAGTHRQQQQQQQQQHRQQSQLDDSSAPNILLVNGRPHRLVASGGREKKARQRRSDEAEQSDFSAPPSAGFESEPVGRRNSRKQPLDANNNNDGAHQQAASFTLLSESQLNRLSRKLMAKATSGAETNARNTARASGSATLATPTRHLLSKYRVLARYRPVKQGSSLIRSLSKRGRNLLSADRAAQAAARRRTSSKHLLTGELEREFSFSSGATSEHSSDSSLSGAEGQPEGDELVEVESDAGLTFADLLGGARSLKSGRSMRSKGRRVSRRVSPPAGHATSSRAGLRQTEECNLSPATARDKRELLLRKYYYA